LLYSHCLCISVTICRSTGVRNTHCTYSGGLLFGSLRLLSKCELSCIHSIFELHMLLCLEIWHCNIFWTFSDGYCLFSDVNISLNSIFSFSRHVENIFGEDKFLTFSFIRRMVVPNFIIGFLYNTFPKTTACVLVNNIFILYL